MRGSVSRRHKVAFLGCRVTADSYLKTDNRSHASLLREGVKSVMELTNPIHARRHDVINHKLNTNSGKMVQLIWLPS